MTLTRTAFRTVPANERKVRTRRCAVKACRAVFEPRSMTHKCCSPGCAMLHVAAEKARTDRKERQAGLAKLKRRADYLKDAQAALNAWIRLVRDRDEPCISCGHADTGQKFDAGHYISRGSRPNLALDERNLAKQCHWCNVHLSGNQILFRMGLVKKHGAEFVEALESDDTPRKYTVEQLIEIKTHYRALTKGTT